MNQQWHYSRDGAQYGPVDESEIIRLIQDGELAPGTPVLKEGSMDWQPARNHASFQVEIYPGKQRPLVQASTSTAPKPASGGTSQSPRQTTAQPVATPSSPTVVTAPLQAAPAASQTPRCIKPMSSLLLGILGCILGGIAVFGIFYDPGETKNLQITGNLGNMETSLMDDTRARGTKALIASFGQWFGAIGAVVGLVGLIAAITHLIKAKARQVIPRRGLAGVGAAVSFIACLSVIAAVKHGYDANVGLHVENTGEIFNRLDQVANIQKKGQQIAEGNVPLQPGDFDERAIGLAETLAGGTLDPLTQLGTEDYLGKRAENVEIYTTAGGSTSLQSKRNTRVILMVMSGNSPACIQAVPILNQLRNEFPLGQLAIMGVSSDKPVVVEAFARRTNPRFPVGTPTFGSLPEPYASAFKKPTFFIIDRTGRIENILIGPQSIAALRTAAKRNP